MKRVIFIVCFFTFGLYASTEKEGQTPDTIRQRHVQADLSQAPLLQVMRANLKKDMKEEPVPYCMFCCKCCCLIALGTWWKAQC